MMPATPAIAPPTIATPAPIATAAPPIAMIGIATTAKAAPTQYIHLRSSEAGTSFTYTISSSLGI